MREINMGLFFAISVVLGVLGTMPARGVGCDVVMSMPDLKVRDMVWTGSMYVAVGDTTLSNSASEGDHQRGIYTTRDGKSWLPGLGPALPNFHRVAWSGTTLVALGNGYIASSDGSGAWKTVAAQAGRDSDLLWTGERFLVISGTTLLASTDGFSWTDVSPGFVGSQTFGSITGNSQELILGGGDVLRISTDQAQTWSRKLLSFDVDDVATGNGVYVVINDSEIWISSDLNSWTSSELEGLQNLSGVTWTGARFVVWSKQGVVLSSEDGQSWQRATLEGRSPRSVVHHGDAWYLASENGQIFESSDLQTWSAVGHSPMELVRVGASNGAVSVIGGRNLYRQEGNGLWQDMGQPFENELTKIIAAGSDFVAGARNGVIYTSGDGLNWERIETAAKRDITDLVAHGSVVLAFSEDIVLYSTDQITWLPVENPISATTAVWDGVRFLASGNSDIMTSTDGMTWEVSVSEGNPPFNGMIFKEGVYYGIRRDLYFSTDGLVWQTLDVKYRGHRPANTFYEVIDTGTHLVTVGNESAIAVSGDPLFWAQVQGPKPKSLLSAFWNGEVIQAVRSDGVVVTAACDGMLGASDFGKHVLIPWVVNNASWQSRVALFHSGGRNPLVYCEATTTEGETRSKLISFSSNSVKAMEAGELFPDITGYSLKLASDETLFASFLTINTEAISGGQSPSQTTAVRMEDLGSRLLFGYAPGKEISAIVLVAPEGAGDIEIDLKLFDHSGATVGQEKVMLHHQQPRAMLIGDLFGVSPEHASVVATAPQGVKIGGATFVFNQKRQPSMSAAISLE